MSYSMHKYGITEDELKKYLVSCVDYKTGETVSYLPKKIKQQLLKKKKQKEAKKCQS